MNLNIAIAVQKLLCYPESCIIITEDGETVGKMYTSLTMSAWGGQPCLLLHAGSYAKIKSNIEVGTSITGFLTSDLKVIQELTHEYVQVHTIYITHY